MLSEEGHVMEDEPGLFRTMTRDRLLSLGSEDVDADVAQAWAAEVQRRSADYAEGKTESRDWRESVRRVRQLLAETRKA